MSLSLEINQKQTISQKMIQSMEILQLNALELRDYLEEQRLENPVIEIEEYNEEDLDSREIDIKRKLEWLSSTDRQNKVYYKDDYNSDDFIESEASNREETLYDYLYSQVIDREYSEVERVVLEYLLQSLDDRGYITDSVDDISHILGTNKDIVCNMIALIKELDPAGVGAKDLRECLLIQISRNGVEDEILKRIINNHLEDIGKNHIDKIARALGIDIDDVKHYMEIIRKLDPKPGSQFSNRNKLRYIIPDAVIVKTGNEFEILVNDYSYPKVAVDSYYKKLLQTTDDKETKKYLRDKINKVNQIDTNLKLRNSTLSKVLHELVKEQIDFFKFGPGNKRPLKISTISNRLNVHESTISRAMSNKYLQCTWGIYPLNYFLTSVAAKNIISGEELTSEKLSKALTEVIEKEDKSKPLSDEKIAKELEKYDIKIARRTVNKYRQALGIPDKSGRKHTL